MFTTDALAAALEGRYTIERLVGEGGMAKVYLARDLRHNRQVALKVLRPDLGAVVGVDRFQAEIQVTANLQHPNLLPLFDSGAAGDLLFYVMPFVEGESLRARLDREKQLPVDEAVRLATAIAGALDYAHRKGVVHRDLKPENVLIHEGQPLVADFGIALAISNAGGARITQTGLSLGTPQYMSPEQATGDRVIDARTDIYSLGALTYEMLTGEPPHVGATAQAIIARVLTETPRSVRITRPSVPEAIEAAVARALEKIPADRFSTAKDFADALSNRSFAPSGPVSSVSARPAPGFSRRERWMASAVVLLVAALGVTSFVAWRTPSTLPAPPAVRFGFDTPNRGSLQIGIAPDGHAVAYIALVSSARVLVVRQLGSLRTDTLRGTGGAFSPHWSPNSRNIAYYADGKVKLVGDADHVVRTVLEVKNSQGLGGQLVPTWVSDSTIVFNATGGRLYRVSSAGGTSSPIAVTPEGRWRSPTSIGDGHHVLAIRATDASGGGADSAGLYIISIEGGRAVRVSNIQSRVGFAAPDRVLFVRDERLFVQRLNTRTFQLEGEPRQIADSVGENSSSRATGFSVSANGILVYSGGSDAAGFRRLTWYSRAGARLAQLGDSAMIAELSLSPDDRWVAMSTRLTAGRESYLVDAARNVSTRLMQASLGGETWARDSRSVFYAKSNSSEIRRLRLGAGEDSLIFRGNGSSPLWPQDVLADGTILFLSSDSLFALPPVAGAKPRFIVSIKGINEVRVSPDGTLVTYGTNESGRREVFVAHYPAMDDRRQVSPAGGVQSRWNSNGRELFYLDFRGRLMSVSVKPGSTTELPAPTILFQTTDPFPAPTLDEWSPGRNGERFLFSEPVALLDTKWWSSLRVVVNWPSLLKSSDTGRN